jgi:hypothetical protein
MTSVMTRAERKYAMQWRVARRIVFELTGEARKTQIERVLVLLYGRPARPHPSD